MFKVIKNKSMAKITIDNKEYEYNELSDNCKNSLNKIRYVQNQIKKLSADLNILKTAQSVYYSELKDEMNTQK
tara:strand:+ start:1064 stop:1282 length:219 start_codon:yes stop_codon:yes gene_type:complete